jgi:hypothetical protein
MPAVLLSDPPVAAPARLGPAIQSATRCRADLLQEVLARGCPRARSMVGAGHGFRLAETSAAGAWFEAALELLRLERPGWQLRRLVQADGQWHCALGRQPLLPLELDDLAEASHPDMALAVLAAVVEALAMPATEPARPAAAAPGLALRLGCDNLG